MTRPLMIAACLALTTVAFASVAQDAAQAPATPAAAAPAPASTTQKAPGNADRGRQLAYTCHGCHGVVGYRNAYPNYRVPKVVGQSEQYLGAALTDYKSGARKHPTMQAQAQSFSDQDIADIAAYISSLK